MPVKYFSSSFSGFVSSYLRKQIPLLAYKKRQGQLFQDYFNIKISLVNLKYPHLCISKIEINSFSMSNMKNTIGLWREASTYLNRKTDVSRLCKSSFFIVKSKILHFMYLSTSEFQVLFQKVLSIWCDHITLSGIVLSCEIKTRIR